MKHSNKLAFTAILILGIAFPALAAQPLPWQREIPLREAARSVSFGNKLEPGDPQPNWNSYPHGSAMTICNLKMRTTLWGPPDRIIVGMDPPTSGKDGRYF